MNNSFSTHSTLAIHEGEYQIFDLGILAKVNPLVQTLPFALKILLENLLRHEDNHAVHPKDIEALIHWDPQAEPNTEVAFHPSRVLLQDFTGVPVVVDLATMRNAIQAMGGNPKRINPLQPVDLVIDHSIQVDEYGSTKALIENTKLEMTRNQERYRFLRWGQQAFDNFRVVPPETGIVHQVNLEYLAQVVITQPNGLAFFDTLVGTDSHTTMINGLGILGWGVGGIEAEAAMLGQPISMLIPQVVGVKLVGSLPNGSTATDAVLTITQILRQHGVVNKFVEYFGPGLSSMSLADRATIANMAPEYGATIGFFPIDQKTIDYLRFTGRTSKLVTLVEAYARRQGLFYDPNSSDPRYSSVIEIDLGTIYSCIAGPKRPQDRILLSEAKTKISAALRESIASIDEIPATLNELQHGSVVIAAITSCTNTSNPNVMLAAGLLAHKAAAKGLKPKPWVKTSLAPGSQVVTSYLNQAGLLPALEAVGFHVVGYGCTTCIGNSGPLPETVAKIIRERKLIVAAVLSGNRNFEGRINPLTRINFLASPPLVIAYALAGTMTIDFASEPLGMDRHGTPVFLKDIWPTPAEVQEAIERSIHPEQFSKRYASVFSGSSTWQNLDVPAGDFFSWEENSTYVRKPPYFDQMPRDPLPLKNIINARVLVFLGNSVTTDHISPAGSIPKESPAGQYLISLGVKPEDFNSYGSRRGNHEVMIRGTFANIRLKNRLVPEIEGGTTKHLPSNQTLSIYDAAKQYAQEETPLIILAGTEYGTGSSRDWAAKGTQLLGVKAVLAKSFERIHRANLVGFGVLPLEFRPGQDAFTLGLEGTEVFSILGLDQNLKPNVTLQILARKANQQIVEFTTVARLDTPNEVDYYRHGGILPFVLRSLLK